TNGGVAVPGFEPGCPLGHVLLRDAYIRSTRQRDSPCLLVKGTDRAGVDRAYGMGGGAAAYGRGRESGLWVSDLRRWPRPQNQRGVMCAAWLRWGRAAPHTCHARYVRLGLLPVFQGEVPEVLGPLVGCMQKCPTSH